MVNFKKRLQTFTVANRPVLIYQPRSFFHYIIHEQFKHKETLIYFKSYYLDNMLTIATKVRAMYYSSSTHVSLHYEK